MIDMINMIDMIDDHDDDDDDDADDDDDDDDDTVRWVVNHTLLFSVICNSALLHRDVYTSTHTIVDG